MSSIDVTDVRTQAEVIVRLNLVNGPQVHATHRSFDIVVSYLSVTYQYDVAHECWTEQNVDASGPKVLKPAADGSRRLGKDYGKAYWGGWGTSGLKNLPDELKSLVEELTPSGELSLPGVG